MLFVTIYFLVSVIALLIASYTDLKKRIIPDELTYGIIVLGLLLHIAESFFANDFWIIVIAAAVTAATFGFSYLLWKAGVWAGGDVKMMTGLAALNPFTLGFIRDFIGLGDVPLLASIPIPIFPLTLFVFSVFAMFPYGAALSFNGMLKNRELMNEVVSEMKVRALQILWLGFVIVGATKILQFFSITEWLTLPIVIVIFMLKGKLKVIAATILFAVALWFDYSSALVQLAFVFFPLLLIYGLIKLYFVSKDKVLKQEVKISEIEEGMISAETLIEEPETKKISALEHLAIGKVIKYLMSNRIEKVLAAYRPRGRVVVSSMSAAGLTDEQVEELKKAEKEGRIGNKLTIKLSAPFVPAMLIAYIVLQIVGDVIWILVYA